MSRRLTVKKYPGLLPQPPLKKGNLSQDNNPSSFQKQVNYLQISGRVRQKLINRNKFNASPYIITIHVRTFM